VTTQEPSIDTEALSALVEVANDRWVVVCDAGVSLEGQGNRGETKIGPGGNAYNGEGFGVFWGRLREDGEHGRVVGKVVEQIEQGRRGHFPE